LQKPLRVVFARPLIAVAVTVAATTAALGLTAATEARPPSTPSPIPADAFRPFTVLAEVPASTATPSPPLAPASSDGVTDQPASGALPSRLPDPSPPGGPIHVVRAGDTLWQIAVWHRAVLAAIVRWNTAVDPRRLVAGQRILVPNGRPMPSRFRVMPSRPSVAMTAPASPTGPSSSGGHRWPLQIRGTITTRFSAAHPGIDIAAPFGTPVRAIARGTVTWSGWKTNGGGYVVVIRHPDGMRSTYNHNRAVALRRGDVVTAGQVIAWVGASGWATGPHLDLRIEMGGRFVDPLALYR
jgi:murein DD-endopeptidase MepM/ murein hydrolase activator NlpD